MKRLLLLLLLLMPLSLSAKVIGENEAKQIGREFLVDKGFRRQPKLDLMFEAPSMRKAVMSSPEYYIFKEEKGGFVIVAGDDCIEAPVIAYSLDGQFQTTGMPENLSEWLGMWRNIVAECRANGTSVGAATSESKSFPSEYYIQTADWNQGDPYNRLCPEYNGSLSVTGCTATATCIIMYYHKWPDCGVGTLDSYTYSHDGANRTVKGFALGHQYEWDKMTMTYNSKSSKESCDAVARLMYDVGVMIGSSYDPNGTGSHAYYVREAITEHMKYDNALRLLYRSVYSDGKWMDIIKEELTNNGPIHYSGWVPNDGGGHAFVLDGWDSSDMVHINWGWGGSGNAYYQMPLLGSYTEGQLILAGFQKECGAVAPSDLRIYNTGLSTSVSYYDAGVPFDAAIKSIGNYGGSAFTGQIAIVKIDRNGQLAQILDKDDITIESNQGYNFSYKDLVLESINPGDRLTVMCKEGEDGEWEQVNYDRERSVVGEILLEDVTTIAELTSLKFDSAKKTITISTKEGAAVKLTDSTGKDITEEALAIDGTTIVFNYENYPVDTYKFSFSKGHDLCEFEVVVGNKE